MAMEVLSFLKRQFNHFNAKRELIRHAPDLRNDAKLLDAVGLVDLIYGDKWKRFFWIKQVRSEISALCQIVEELKPKIILEIGTANGGSLFLLTKLASKDATILSIDLPFGKFGGGYPSYRTAFYKTFCTDNQQMHLLRGDSHSVQNFEITKKLLGTRKVDFLFIDGDHTYEGVKKDFEMYSKLVSENGIVAFHDIAFHGLDSDCKVNKFWNEIRKEYSDSREFVEDDNQLWAGIGVLSQKDKITG